MAWAAVALVLAFLVFVNGVFAGEFLGLKGAGDFCPARPDVPTTSSLGIRNVTSLVPLSNECIWADGVRQELVPGWINPAVTLLLITAAALSTLGIRAGWVRHRQATDTNGPDLGRQP